MRLDVEKMTDVIIEEQASQEEAFDKKSVDWEELEELLMQAEAAADAAVNAHKYGSYQVYIPPTPPISPTILGETTTGGGIMPLIIGAHQLEDPTVYDTNKSGADWWINNENLNSKTWTKI